MSRLRPKVVLWWGIALIVGSLIMNYTLYGIIGAASGGGSANPLDQAMISVLLNVLDAVNRTAPLLGAALVGASIVMFYIAKTAAPEAAVAEQDAAA